MAHLEAKGIRCWIAPRDPVPGIPYGEQIVRAIEGAAVVVFILSSDSNHSRAVLGEIELAVNRDKMILPYRIADVSPSPGLEYYIRSIQWQDALGPDAQASLDALARRVQGLLDRTAPVAQNSTVSALLDPPVAVVSPAVSPVASPAVSHVAPTVDPPATPSVPPVVSPEEQQRLVAAIARYVGPIARILVARAVRSASSASDLYDHLAGEIENADERRRFRESCDK